MRNALVLPGLVVSAGQQPRGARPTNGKNGLQSEVPTTSRHFEKHERRCTSTEVPPESHAQMASMGSISLKYEVTGDIIVRN